MNINNDDCNISTFIISFIIKICFTLLIINILLLLYGQFIGKYIISNNLNLAVNNMHNTTTNLFPNILIDPLEIPIKNKSNDNEINHNNIRKLIITITIIFCFIIISYGISNYYNYNYNNLFINNMSYEIGFLIIQSCLIFYISYINL
jgi:hypothetical protein